ncbi:MAG: SRPBCC family protein [Bdellovibrio sp.]|nr:SRPBCC family protein [Bdellovibrio sp.]
MRKAAASLGVLAVGLVLIAASSSDVKPTTQDPGPLSRFPIDSPLPELPKSLYTDGIASFSKNFKLPDPAGLDHSANPVRTWGIKTRDHSLYIGSAKHLWIRAPKEKVVEVLSDFDSYSKFFDEVKKVEVKNKEGNKWTVFWERYSPAFFIPNPKYEMVYLIENSAAKVMYRYQFKKGNSLKASDGLISVETFGDGTLVSGIDFYDASWGLAGAIASGKIWRKSLEGGYKGDLSLKFHIENPQWDRGRIKDEIERMLERYPIDTIQYLDVPQWK